MAGDNSLGTGAYYRKEDYAGFLRRLIVIFVDSALLVAFGSGLWVALILAAWAVRPNYDPSFIFLAVWLSFAWTYLVLMKRSRIRTVGYQLVGVKIVSTKAERPSVWAMTFRMMLWIFGPINMLFDLLWLGADSENQSLRDCFAGTYVVRKNAEPIGFAPMHLTRYAGAGLFLSYPRVCRPAVDDGDSFTSERQ